ncbi:hypothetical protein [Phenylobacterium sp.]|uniref:hypothetical protein n=1 Tax=Phenylobacterium sp. TaxID=1871053 RepID=UPI0025DC9446|nr:hypothetical protein [Phenylobacterium sp.]MBX3482777.1 hypothetical protein [Phenylobacterium sp.]MCW5759873.1 hypothetical protein [Phenylobacterium sp.]
MATVMTGTWPAPRHRRKPRGVPDEGACEPSSGFWRVGRRFDSTTNHTNHTNKPPAALEAELISDPFVWFVWFVVE